MNLKLLTLALVLATTASADPVEDMWKKRCKSCHSMTGDGKTKTGETSKIKSMRTPGWQAEWTDAKLRKVISEGVKNTKMKPFKKSFTPTEIDLLIAHIRTFRDKGASLLQESPPPGPMLTAQNDPPEFPVAPVRPQSNVIIHERPQPPSNPDQPAPADIRASLEAAARAPLQEAPAPAPDSKPTPYLAYAGIGLSVIALVIALRRKR